MRSLVLLCCLLVPGISVALSAQPGASSIAPTHGTGSQVVVFGTFDAPPLASRTDQGRLAGYLGAYLSALQTRSQLNFEVRFYASLDELKQALNAHEIDAAGPLVPTQNPPVHALFTRPLERLPVAIVDHARNRSNAVVAEQLSGRRVAVLQAGIADGYLDSLPEARFVGVGTDIDALEALAFGRVDFAAVEHSRATFLLDRHGLSNLRIAGHMPFLYEPAIAVRSDRPALFAEFIQAIESLPAAERQSIRDAWLDLPQTAWHRRAALLAALAASVLLLGAALYCAVRFGREARARGQHLEQERIKFARSQRLYRALASGISDIVTLHAPDGAILYASPSTQQLTGLSPRQLLGLRLTAFVHPEDRERACGLTGDGAAEGSSARGTVRIRCREGEYRSFEYVAQAFQAGGTGEFVVVSRDVTERLKVDAELQQAHHRYRYLAYHDARTGLPNREGFFVRLNEALRAAKRDDEGLSLLVIDIDDFKTINDSRGYATGEELLDSFVLRLQVVTHGQCELARLGGDEFVALVPHADCERLDALATTIVAAFAQPTPLRGEMAYLTVSGGAARFPQDGSDSESLLAAANIALHAAKMAGKNTWRSYTEGLGRDASQRAISLQNLRTAFERGDFTLHYQPKVRLATGSITGYEALLRCSSATGICGTAELIAAAEHSGFIVTLGEWVLRTAARQCIAWRGTQLERPIAVNVSALQLHDKRFIALMRELVDEDPQLATSLVLELTESALAHEVEHALRTVDELAAMGFAMHIDDFGTGYSSLSRLSRMPVSTLKIDRSFVSDTPQGTEACEIVKGVIALARALKLNVIAEGVETPAQVEFLKACGCDEAQGYLFGRPVSAEDLCGETHRTSAAGIVADATA